VYYTIGCKGVLKLLAGQTGTQRTAVFRAIYALSEPNKKPVFFTGERHGHIALDEHGEGGFGYDPLFIPDGETKTFAQMTIEEKNMVSHRGRAIEKLITFLRKKK